MHVPLFQRDAVLRAWMSCSNTLHEHVLQCTLNEHRLQHTLNEHSLQWTQRWRTAARDGPSR